MSSHTTPPDRRVSHLIAAAEPLCVDRPCPGVRWRWEGASCSPTFLGRCVRPPPWSLALHASEGAADATAGVGGDGCAAGEGAREGGGVRGRELGRARSRLSQRRGRPHSGCDAPFPPSPVLFIRRGVLAAHRQALRGVFLRRRWRKVAASPPRVAATGMPQMPRPASETVGEVREPFASVGPDRARPILRRPPRCGRRSSWVWRKGGGRTCAGGKTKKAWEGGGDTRRL